MSDLIDRQQAINALSTITMYKGSIPFDTAVMRIEQLPSAEPEQLGTNLAEVGTDCISRQAAIDAMAELQGRASTKAELKGISKAWKRIKKLPSAQPTVHPQRTCVNCGRTVNNGGWYADGGTRCPIEEHYALPKDGYCHLWEKRNVTDDDYPEGRADE